MSKSDALAGLAAAALTGHAFLPTAAFAGSMLGGTDWTAPLDPETQMKRIPAFLATTTALLALTGSSFAQDHTMQGHGTAAVEPPAACQAAAAPEMPGMAEMHRAMDGMGEHQKAFMQGMMATEGPMLQGMMAEDPDIAFACAMIPHHQGAISMAEVQLQHGDSEEMKQLARKVIEAQTEEIEQLTRWIEEQGR